MHCRCIKLYSSGRIYTFFLIFFFRMALRKSFSPNGPISIVSKHFSFQIFLWPIDMKSPESRENWKPEKPWIFSKKKKIGMRNKDSSSNLVRSLLFFNSECDTTDSANPLIRYFNYSQREWSCAVFLCNMVETKFKIEIK